MVSKPSLHSPKIAVFRLVLNLYACYPTQQKVSKLGRCRQVSNFYFYNILTREQCACRDLQARIVINFYISYLNNFVHSQPLVSICRSKLLCIIFALRARRRCFLHTRHSKILCIISNKFKKEL